jgi:hypothetical protein
MQIDPNTFYAVHLGDWLTIGIVALAALTYKLERSKSNREQTDIHDSQVRMHTENRERLDHLLEFKNNQTAVNNKRDDQISELREQTAELKVQTARITEIAVASNRRMELVENELLNNRRA